MRLKTAEQSVHLTLGILRQSQAVSYALAFFWLDGFAVPAPAQVTQTVGQPRAKQSQKEIINMNAIVTVNESRSDTFEKKCNELVAQGYILQSSHCSFFDRDGYTPEGIWLAIFALPDVVQKN